MRTPLSVLFVLILFSFNAVAQQPADCNCGLPGLKLAFYKNRVLICGGRINRGDYIEYKVDTNKTYDFVIKDCKTGEYISYQKLLDEEDNEYTIKDNKDSLIIERLIELDDGSMNGIDVPMSYMVIKVNSSGEVVKSNFKYCFKPPVLTPFQKDSISRLCKWLQDSIVTKHKQLEYNTDPSVTLLGGLLLGAVCGDTAALRLFNEFPKYFNKGDGPLDEIYYTAGTPARYILSHQGRDTSQMLKIKGIAECSVLPTTILQDNCVGELNHDTLNIIASASYAYFPFGKINNKGWLSSELLRNFKVLTKINEGKTYYLLNEQGNRLIFCFDTIESGVESSTLVKGDITDNTVSLLHGVHVGMSKQDFFNVFFTDYPDMLFKKSDVFEIECCAIDIKHYYTFKNGKLASIKFVQDGTSPYSIDFPTK